MSSPKARTSVDHIDRAPATADSTAPSSSSYSSLEKTEQAGNNMGVETAHNEHEAAVRSMESTPPPSIPEEADNNLRWSRVKRTIWHDAFSEFFGTFIMIMFGDGVVAQTKLSKQANGDYQSISWAWGIGVMIGVYVAGKSGGHLNPAVTVASCMYRKFPWRKLPVYFLAQLLGAMTAAAVVYANYKSAINVFEGGSDIRTVTGDHATAGIFCTYPAEFLSTTGQFFSEYIASTILMFCLFGLADNGAGNLMPLMICFLIFAIGACFGWETGYAINLARDFGPRLVTYMIGYGHEVWSAGNYYFWIPMVAPFFGTLTGGFLYDCFLYTGNDSPVNTRMFGIPRLFPNNWKRSVWSNTYEKSETSKV